MPFQLYHPPLEELSPQSIFWKLHQIPIQLCVGEFRQYLEVPRAELSSQTISGFVSTVLLEISSFKLHVILNIL